MIAGGSESGKGICRIALCVTLDGLPRFYLQQRRERRLWCDPHSYGHCIVVWYFKVFPDKHGCHIYSSLCGYDIVQGYFGE